MREIRSKLLWIGGAGDLCDPQFLLDSGVSAVVDLAGEEAAARLPRELIYCRFPLLDGDGNDARILGMAVKTVTALFQAKIPSLVACSAGASRSPAITAYAMAVASDQSPTELLREIAAVRPVAVNGFLWKQLGELPSTC